MEPQQSTSQSQAACSEDLANLLSFSTGALHQDQALRQRHVCRSDGLLKAIHKSRYAFSFIKSSKTRKTPSRCQAFLSCSSGRVVLARTWGSSDLSLNSSYKEYTSVSQAKSLRHQVPNQSEMRVDCDHKNLSAHPNALVRFWTISKTPHTDSSAERN